MFGYVANAKQTPESLEALSSLYSLFPAIGSLIAALIMAKFYTLREADVDEMATQV